MLPFCCSGQGPEQQLSLTAAARGSRCEPGPSGTCTSVPLPKRARVGWVSVHTVSMLRRCVGVRRYWSCAPAVSCSTGLCRAATIGGGRPLPPPGHAHASAPQWQLQEQRGGGRSSRTAGLSGQCMVGGAMRGVQCLRCAGPILAPPDGRSHLRHLTAACLLATQREGCGVDVPDGGESHRALPLPGRHASVRPPVVAPHRSGHCSQRNAPVLMALTTHAVAAGSP